MTESPRRNFIPAGLRLLRHYQRSWLRPDVLAGITVAAYLVPQVMAYADVAGLAPVVGLWAVIGSLLVYTVFGSSRQLSVGPESTTALMTAVTVAPLAAGDPARYATLATTLALLVGVLCLLGAAARLGFLADLLSRPVLVGYMAGVAVIMIVGQLGKITGAPVAGESVIDRVSSIADQVDRIHAPTLILAGGMLAFLFIVGRLLPKLPVPLFAVLLATAVTVLFSLRDLGIQVIGTVPAGIPTPGLPAVSGVDLAALVLPAIGVMMVGYSDNVLTARSFATRNSYRIDANAEMLALGTANIAAGLLRGFPVSSSASRTAIGDSLGSRSQVHSLVAVGAVVLVLLVGGPVLTAFPTAALGALVIYAAVRLIELGEFRRIGTFRRSELALALATTAGVLLVDVLYGVLVAIGLSILDLLRRLARPHDGILGEVPGVAGMHDIDDYPRATRIPGLVVYRYDAPLCFANADNFRHRALAAVEDSPTPVTWFLLNAEANVEVDITAVDALEDLRAELTRRGIVFAMARVKQDLHDALAKGGFVERVGDDRIFPTLPTAVAAFRQWHTEQFGR
ncbi:high affinity sulfate transporter 1 [Kibdelosporangium banguiense]|uniref:High affinity sulfate transporter 1 n=1 Tax=Kibdelosporangium banguiense TaxID=1365924 RepID=A0ABS4TUN3_9PSEU|nr:sulfate permease [Kibdelosporangium banguiense]MBP2328129.1 high affinity sulfate transporter 1 [Kibdelosporangium banguiense]